MKVIGFYTEDEPIYFNLSSSDTYARETKYFVSEKVVNIVFEITSFSVLILTFPLKVLAEAQKELVNYGGLGISVMGM